MVFGKQESKQRAGVGGERERDLSPRKTHSYRKETPSPPPKEGGLAQSRRLSAPKPGASRKLANETQQAPLSGVIPQLLAFRGRLLPSMEALFPTLAAWRSRGRLLNPVAPSSCGLFHQGWGNPKVH